MVKTQNFEKHFLIIWSVVNFVITTNQFGPFSKPQRPHKTSDQYQLKYHLNQLPDRTWGGDPYVMDHIYN